MNVYIYDKTVGIPEDDTCYIIGKKGPYLKKKLDLISSLTPVDKISFLEDVPTYAELHIPKIPSEMTSKILGFFKAVYEKYKSEAIVFLYYNKKNKTYKIHVPKQTVSGTGLRYESNESIPNHILVGDIHSHGASMSAFHSSTDINDELTFDGLHITIGKVNDDLFDICGSIVVNGMRVIVDPEEYVDGLESKEFIETTQFDGTENAIIRYTLNVSESDYLFNKEWMDQVEEKKIKSERYVYVNGELTKLTFPNQTIFDFTKYSKIDETNVDQDIKDCICSECIHRCEKLKLQDLEDIAEENLIDNFENEDLWRW